MTAVAGERCTKAGEAETTADMMVGHVVKCWLVTGNDTEVTAAVTLPCVVSGVVLTGSNTCCCCHA